MLTLSVRFFTFLKKTKTPRINQVDKWVVFCVLEFFSLENALESGGGLAARGGGLAAGGGHFGGNESESGKNIWNWQNRWLTTRAPSHDFAMTLVRLGEVGGK